MANLSRRRTKTDLGYEVCDDVGAGRTTWESCTSNTFAGSLLWLMAMGLGFCASYGADKLLPENKNSFAYRSKLQHIAEKTTEELRQNDEWLRRVVKK